MKVRIKFIKQGTMKFIGHLDVMRYFQKVNRRSFLPVRYSEGFSPHQIMSFSNPLGLGDTSDAEYMDVEFTEAIAKDELISRMNAVNVPELTVLDAVELDDNAKNAMSLLAAADYTLTFREAYQPENLDAFFTEFLAFCESPEIVILKETKKSKKMVDIKPQIHEIRREGDAIFMKVNAGSGEGGNLKPELVVKAFYESKNMVLDDMALMLNRVEQYGLTEEGELQTLLQFGKSF